MSDPHQTTTSIRTGLPGGPIVFILVLFIVGIFAQRLFNSRTTEPFPMPSLTVEGWLNTADGEPLTRESLLGRHVVIDTWATWCEPCRAAMPELAQVYGRWADRGVVFIGLTEETAGNSQKVADYAATVPGFDWPIGYGARLVWDQMRVESIPTLFLFDPEGIAVWRGSDLRKLERELKRRVASKDD